MGKKPSLSKKMRVSRRGRSGPTIADVAHAADVSPMTVSRVINGEQNVLAATKGKVNAAIDRLGYVPNPAARSLAGGQQCGIALIYSNPSASYLSELMVGGLAESLASNIQFSVESYLGEETPAELVARLLGHRIDAVLLPPPLCDDEALLAAFDAAKMPMAQLATGQPVSGAHAVTIDDESAAHAMTSRLLSLGHRQIGFIAGNTNQTASASRRAGHVRALAEAGLAADEALMAQGDFTYRSGLAAVVQLLARIPRPTAIFASNDDMAAAAVAGAHRLGLDVPGDVSICGFDDTAMATMIWPELTTVRQPIAEMARRGIRQLARAVRACGTQGNLPPQHEQLAFEIVVRASDSARPDLR
jgi:LacI family transcriptional regulator